jgi:hypothetical protein
MDLVSEAWNKVQEYIRFLGPAAAPAGIALRLTEIHAELRTMQFVPMVSMGASSLHESISLESELRRIQAGRATQKHFRCRELLNTRTLQPFCRCTGGLIR